MDFKKFKAIAQDKDSYTVEHPGGRKLFIEKNGLSKEAHKQILHLFSGAMVDGSSAGNSQSISDMGGGDPTASFKVGEGLSQLAGASEPMSSSPRNDANAYKEYAPDLTAEDIADLDKPVLNKDGSAATGVSTDPAAVKARAKMAQDVSQFPVPAGQDSTSLQPGAADQGLAIAQDGVNGRGPNAASGDPLVAQKSGYEQLLQQQIGEQEAAQAAGQASGKEIADIQQQGANALSALPSLNDTFAKYQNQDAALGKAYADAKIDPQHFMHSMGTGSKILTGIGMVLSGMGSATTGQPSYAMQVIKDATDRDIQAQMEDKSGKLNLWKMNREAMGSDIAANLATQNQYKAATLQQLQAAQTRAILPQEKLRSQQAIDQLKQEMLQNNMQRALITSGGGAQSGGQPNLSSVDPAIMVPQFIKDPGQQAKAFEEIRKRQNIAANGQAMFNALEDAVKETSGVGGSVKSMLPDAMGFTSPAVSKLNNLAQPMLDTIDESVRQSGKDSFLKNVMPRGTDNAAQTQGRREALAQWLKSQAAAPISLGASGRAIDLNRFQSTAIPNFGTPTAPQAPQTIERRAQDGRIIIYDAKTKQPLGVKK